MEDIGNIIVVVLIIVAAVSVLRWLGAWMLRIDEVINVQKQILEELRKRNNDY